MSAGLWRKEALGPVREGLEALNSKVELGPVRALRRALSPFGPFGPPAARHVPVVAGSMVYGVLWALSPLYTVP